MYFMIDGIELWKLNEVNIIGIVDKIRFCLIGILSKCWLWIYGVSI